LAQSMEKNESNDLGGLSDPRVVFAAERTLLAWVRTGLAMMGFGFVVARFGLFLRELAAAHGEAVPHSPGYSIWIGAALILFGVLVNILSAVQHVKTLAQLRRGETYRPSVWSLGLIVTGVLAALGIVMTAYVVFSAL
jgi:putative membrane protein